MGLFLAAKKYGKELDYINIGYGGFYCMRMELAKMVGYEYYYGKNPWTDFRLRWDDEHEKDELTRFFLHSDCDGKIMQSDLKKLYEDFKDLNFNDKKFDGKTAKVCFEEFLPFLKRTVESNAHIEFY
jgi:hypothetical protein